MLKNTHEHSHTAHYFTTWGGKQKGGRADLGEAKARETEELLGLKDGDRRVLQGASLAVVDHLVLRQHQLALGREQRSKDVEDDDAGDDAVNVGDRHARLDVELRQRALAGHDLADDRGGKAEHGHAAHEELVGLGEAEGDGHGGALSKADLELLAADGAIGGRAVADDAGRARSGDLGGLQARGG